MATATAVDAQAPVAPPAKSTFHNPIKRNGADPWMTYHDGWYYLCTTTGGDIQLRRAQRLVELKNAKDQVVWKDDNAERSHQMWAAEFVRLDAGEGRGMRWYCYYTANRTGARDDTGHRMYVLESERDDPMGPYTFKAKLKTDPNDAQYAIDGSIIQAGGKMYLVWCGRPSAAGQGIYISRMTNPWTLAGERAYLETDGFGCKHVREGPVALPHAGKINLIYSMCSADTPDYRLGMLIAEETADLADPKSWRQHPSVVFARNDEAKVYGPAHNFFFKSPDGKQDWIVYHGKTSTRVTYGDRATRAQPFTWNTDGTPNFGKPLGDDVAIEAPSGEN